MSVYWRAPLVALVLSFAQLASAGPVQSTQPPSRVEAAHAHFLLGEASYRAARWQAALTEFRAGYALDPRPEFLLNMAQTERRLGQYQAALTDCQRFLAQATDSRLDGQVRQLMAELRAVELAARESGQRAAKMAAVDGARLLAAGNPAGALAAYQRAYLDDIDEPSYLRGLADCYRALGRQDDARRFYRMYLHERPHAPDRAEVESMIALLPSVAPAAPASAVPAPALSPVVTRTSVESSPRPVWKRWWLWTAVAGAVAVGVGVGVGVGVWQSSRDAFRPTLPGFGPGGMSSGLGAR